MFLFLLSLNENTINSTVSYTSHDACLFNMILFGVILRSSKRNFCAIRIITVLVTIVSMRQISAMWIIGKLSLTKISYISWRKQTTKRADALALTCLSSQQKIITCHTFPPSGSVINLHSDTRDKCTARCGECCYISFTDSLFFAQFWLLCMNVSTPLAQRVHVLTGGS